MTQKEQVLDTLKNCPLTQLQATNKLGVLRLSERIRELQKDGHNIKHTPIVVFNRFGKECRVMQYSLIDNTLSIRTEINEDTQHGGSPA